MYQRSSHPLIAGVPYGILVRLMLISSLCRRQNPIFISYGIDKYRYLSNKPISFEYLPDMHPQLVL